MSALEIKVTEERMNKTLTVGDIIGAQEGKLIAMRNIVARFVVDKDGTYLDFKKACDLVDKLTPSKLAEVAEKLFEDAEEKAVPKDNAPA